MHKRTIAIVTGSRAEYGLLYWLIRALHEDEQVELQLLVTGTHLRAEFGSSYKDIEYEFPITRKIDILSDKDSPLAICHAIAKGTSGFAQALSDLKPDILVLLGDRYEILAAAISAMIQRIPIAHIHGGETTEGVIDESIRHSITKMSQLHFVATETYKNRVIQLGESPENVFNYGGIGIDNIRQLPLLDRLQFEQAIHFKLNKRNILVTFHPVTLEHNSTKKQFNELLLSIDKLSDSTIIFTYANADTDGRIINQLIDEYVSRNSHKAIAFQSLGQLRYLSALQFIDVCVGNSSSGLIEVPSFKKATINIGDRQKGRIKATSVIDCAPLASEIDKAFALAFSDKFHKTLQHTINPYGTGGVSQKIKQVLLSCDLSASILKKTFYDLNIK